MDFKAMLNQLSHLSEAKQETKTGLVHKSEPGGYGRKDDEDDKKKEKVAEPAVKRGRGRPPSTGAHTKNPEEKAKQEKSEKAGKELQSFMVGNLPKGKLPGKTTKKHTLKDWMEIVEDNMLSENEVKEALAPGQKPIPVVGKVGDTQQTGAGFLHIDDTSPAGQAMSKALGDLVGQKKAQIVMPSTPQTAGAKPMATGSQPTAAGATGQAQPGQQSVGEDAIDDANFARKRMNIPASQRKAQGGDWRVSQQDLKNLPAGTRTTSQGLAAHAKRQGLGEQGVAEGGILKSIKRGLQGWGTGDAPTPKELVRQNKGYSDDAIKALARDTRNINPHTPGGLQKRVVDREMKKRGLGEQGVAEGLEDYSAKKARAGQDIGKPGKQFAKIAKGAAEKYGSEEKGKKVAGAVLKKLRSSQKESIEEGFMDSVKGMFGKKPTAAPSMGQQSSGTSSNMDIDLSADPNREPYRFMRVPSNASREIIKSKFRTLAKKYHPDMQGGNSDVMAKLNTAIAKIAYNMGVPRLEEADIPSDQMDMGAGLGAGRSATTLEGKKAKPDFLDLDKDGNKKESMKKAAHDKKKKKVTESSHRHNSARHLGKSHALAKEGYNCRFDDMDEARMYHEGYKEGLDECYGQGVYEMAPPSTVSGMASAAMSMPSMEEDMFDEGRLPDSPFELDDYPFPKGPAANLPPGYIPPKSPHKDEPSTAFRGPMMPHPSKVQADSDFMDYTLAREGNAFTGALANTPKGGKFSLGGKSFTDTSDLDEMSLAFESLDKQLKSLLESEEVTEGMTVSISKGQQGMPDSVTVSAQDAEADQLLGLIKHAGLGLFADDQSAGYGSPSDSQGAKMHGDISVVDDHDGMMSLMKKVAGIGDSEQSQDYEDEESQDDDSHAGEEVCETCQQPQCQCEDTEQVQEVESEDQMGFEVAEGQSDAEEKETTADENAEAEEDKALAIQNSKDDEQVDESLANGADDTFEADINFMTKAISGGLNKQKSTGQTTIPVIAGQNDRMGYSTNESMEHWLKLAGIK